MCDELQAVEHIGLRRAARRFRALRQGPHRSVLKPRADVRSRRVSEYADGPLPQVMLALRGSAMRSGMPDRCQLQAGVGRHRARRLRQVHRLQVLLVGLSVRRARDRPRAQGDDQMHAVRRSHLQRGAAGSRAQAGMRDGLSDFCAAVRRHPRPRFDCVAGDPRERRLRADARMGHTPIEPLPAAAQDADARSTRTSSFARTIR